MANEILFPAAAIGNYKAVISKGATVWNGSAMVATTAAAKASGAIAMARQGTTLDYVCSFPAGIVTAGRYAVTVINAATPDGTEPPVGADSIDWTGAAENVSNDASITTSLNTIAGYVDTEVAAIKTKTDALPADTAATLATLATAAAQTTAATSIAAVKAKTDNLPADTTAALATLATATTLAAVKAKTDALPADTAATLATLATATAQGTAATNLGAIKAKTDGLPTVPADNAAVLAVKVVSDKLGTLIAGSGPYEFSGAALVNAPAGAGGGAITLDLTQMLPTSASPGTVGEALLAARAQAFGKWVISGTTLTLYAPDGTTALRSFTLNSATAPTQRV